MGQKKTNLVPKIIQIGQQMAFFWLFSQITRHWVTRIPYQAQDPAIREALFGSPSDRGSDGIHFRGKEGRKRHTSSVIAALKSAGLGGWSSQGPRRAGRQEAGRSYSQAVRTSNQFDVLNC